jgi:hypothetical protein
MVSSAPTEAPSRAGAVSMARELANGRAGEDERRAFASPYPYVTTVYSGGLERPAGVVVTPRRGPGWSRVRALRGPAGSLAAPRAHGRRVAVVSRTRNPRLAGRVHGRRHEWGEEDQGTKISKGAFGYLYG